jgi:hypothetical protein
MQLQLRVAAALQVVRLRAKLTDAAGAVKGIFGIKSEKDPAVAKLEALQVWCHLVLAGPVVLACDVGRALVSLSHLLRHHAYCCDLQQPVHI